MRMNLDHVAGGHLVLGRDVHCEFDYWPLAVSMPGKLKISCTSPVKERQKFVSELSIGRNKTECA